MVALIADREQQKYFKTKATFVYDVGKKSLIQKCKKYKTCTSFLTGKVISSDWITVRDKI